MTNDPTESPADPAPDALESRRKRLRFRSWHRGTREMDLIMGSFADAATPAFDAVLLDQYEALLELSDPDLYNWITGKEPVPAEHDTEVMQRLVAFRYTPRQGS
ncbi:succinate dehydrogenase assembly factor 2 [Azospirillum sp.]|uniref:FAD assembly factor SdhE n=1 Tax=Azospirillum sp. TaxID=34012 RepID=UPI003D7637F0